MTASYEADPLFATPQLTFPEFESCATLQERYEQFRDLNPSLLPSLERLTDEWLAQGHTRLGIGMLFEVLRWRAAMATRSDHYKLNNNYLSRFVRDLIARRPEFSEVFETRELRAA